MSSLGYHTKPNIVVRTKVEPSPHPPPQTMYKTSRRATLLSLVVLNVVLGIGHVTLAITIASFDIAFPLTLTENILKPSIVDQFRCNYDWGNRTDNGKPYCEDHTKRTTNETCLLNYIQTPDISSITLDNETGGPLIQSYTISQINTASNGKLLSKWLLFTIAAITAAFHFLYAITFHRAKEEEKNKTSNVLDFMTGFGGLPSRWTEYSLSASLMSFFAGNVSNVFDINALVAFSLGTFALMFYGQLIEYTAFNGMFETSLMLFYIPGMALFTLTWFPLVRSATSDALLRFLCNDENPGLFCQEPTCFGVNTPIPLFIFVLGLLFCVFPLIESIKLYRLFHRERSSCLMSIGSFTYFAFLSGPTTAVRRLLRDVFFPLIMNESMIERQQEFEWHHKVDVVLKGEFAYAIASATSKYFLYIFFLINFASRNW